MIEPKARFEAEWEKRVKTLHALEAQRNETVRNSAAEEQRLHHQRQAEVSRMEDERATLLQRLEHTKRHVMETPFRNQLPFQIHLGKSPARDMAAAITRCPSSEKAPGTVESYPSVVRTAHSNEKASRSKKTNRRNQVARRELHATVPRGHGHWLEDRGHVA